ncbi:MAG: DUF2625 family protein [Flavobacterium sp.]|uniref:DUF2625 domain-containing protein n=1 Tax=Myroides marinus TaxID=703342 RepID=A0A161SLA9_9FLAO|nr:DUF2625 family protein [Myroides marinus]KZE82975.1 hypothetical protein AV926_05365 [Myroides marinus]
MRTLEELINTEDPGLAVVKEWIQDAIRPVEILPQHSRQIAEEALLQLQITTRSPLGAIVYETGGLLIDNGWIRVLGGGFKEGENILTSALEWNTNKTIDGEGSSKGYYIVALDVLGGYFCINSGALGSDVGSIYYFAPDTLDFEALDISYSDMLHFFITGNLDQFYQDFRWGTWKEDVAGLTLDRAFYTFPPMWTKEGKHISNTSIKDVPAEELYQINHDFRSGLDNIENKYL